MARSTRRDTEASSEDNLRTIDDLYEAAINSPFQDLRDHLGTLKFLGSRFCHITEFGTRTGNSAAAFLAGRPKKLITYDINCLGFEDEFRKVAAAEGIEFVFRNQDCLREPIESTDLLFIDSEHTFEHVNKALEMHSGQVRSAIVLHDTHWETSNQPVQSPSWWIWRAINKHTRNGVWKVTYDALSCNGLTVIEQCE